MTKQKHFYLIRGLIREQAHWGSFLAHLEKNFPDARISLFDIPGVGRYFKESSPLTIKSMMEFIRQEYLTIKKQNEDSHLVAISLGGMIGVEWMKNYPQDFDRATLINTSLGGVSPFYDRLMPRAFLDLLIVPLLSGREKEAHMLKLVTNHRDIFDSTLELWESIQKERPVSLDNTLRQLFAAAFYRPREFNPIIPVQLIASTQDRMVSVKCSRALSRRWNVPLIEHTTAGHDLTADAPEWVAKEIKKNPTLA